MLARLKSSVAIEAEKVAGDQSVQEVYLEMRISFMTRRLTSHC